MSTERWERTKQILEEALRLARDQRQVYLDQACGSDSDLRADVESLIASHEAAGSPVLYAAAPGPFPPNPFRQPPHAPPDPVNRHPPHAALARRPWPLAAPARPACCSSPAGRSGGEIGRRPGADAGRGSPSRRPRPPRRGAPPGGTPRTTGGSHQSEHDEPPSTA